MNPELNLSFNCSSLPDERPKNDVLAAHKYLTGEPRLFRITSGAHAKRARPQRGDSNANANEWMEEKTSTVNRELPPAASIEQH